MYEELIKNLRVCSQCDFGQDCNGCTQKSDDAFCCDKLLHQAADAIEELKKDLEQGQDYYEFWKHKAEQGLKMLQVAISNMPCWIPVTERLPEEDTSCLVFLVGGEFGQLSWMSMAIFYNGVFHYDDHSGEFDQITHWMPLPQPPTNDDE